MAHTQKEMEKASQSARESERERGRDRASRLSSRVANNMNCSFRFREPLEAPWSGAVCVCMCMCVSKNKDNCVASSGQQVAESMRVESLKNNAKQLTTNVDYARSGSVP